jgi:hypothetical protein
MTVAKLYGHIPTELGHLSYSEGDILDLCYSRLSAERLIYQSSSRILLILWEHASCRTYAETFSHPRPSR